MRPPISFSIYFILETLGLEVNSAPNGNKYQKIFLGVKRGQRARLTISPPPVRRLCRQCGILNTSGLHGLLQG
jgi:hypothetical protein